MHMHNTDHMSRPGSPGTQMRLMEMRLLGYLWYEPYRKQEGLLPSYQPGAGAKATAIKTN